MWQAINARVELHVHAKSPHDTLLIFSETLKNPLQPLSCTYH